MELLNQPVDISNDFYRKENDYFVAGPVTHFNAASASGTIQWLYHRWVEDEAFLKMGSHLERKEKNKVLWNDAAVHPEFGFSLSFIDERTVRWTMRSSRIKRQEHPSLMLEKKPSVTAPWPYEENEESCHYRSEEGSVIIYKKAFRLEIRDRNGKLLTATQGTEILEVMHHKNLPTLFTRRASDGSRSMAACFSLAHGEKIFGAGESFTALDKRGQRLVLWTTDVQSAATREMYKPVPFIISSRGYGMFMHTSTPLTLDIGCSYAGSNHIFIGEDELDIFLFIGKPKDILASYTALTGRSPLPPLWSFGLWMSRFSYQSQDEVESVADNLRKHRIPCDVIHVDAGWFRNGINCDFVFNPQTFPDPKAMTDRLREQGFRTSVWQLPYFTQQNELFEDIIARRLFVKDGNGNVSTDDAVLDLSNADTQEWYTYKLKTLFDLGVSVVKADFGEASPLRANYASGRSGFYEHNLYPLRYTKLLFDVTRDNTREPLIWARSAWAGGQRYPVHWSGDAEVSDIGMAGTLRAGLSLGLCGFTFWSHDIGGFFDAPKEELFLRWAFMGMFSSHSRVHGFPPREPWAFSEHFKELFRQIVLLKYKLMPYIYTQAAISAQAGLPLLRSFFLEYPDDPVAGTIDDQYLLGNHLLIAPVMETDRQERLLYLPEGQWIDYFTHTVYEGRQWMTVKTGTIPGVMLVRYGHIIPHIAPALSTAFMDWSNIDLICFSRGGEACTGDFYDPVTRSFSKLVAEFENNRWRIEENDQYQRASFHIKSFDW